MSGIKCCAEMRTEAIIAMSRSTVNAARAPVSGEDPDLWNHWQSVSMCGPTGRLALIVACVERGGVHLLVATETY